MTYVTETWTPEEAAVLGHYFTNLDQPVFAIHGLPMVTVAALFARYSRTHKSLRRLFLDEFATGLDGSGAANVDDTKGSALFDRVFFAFGDDSVAQLGGAHLACEQASNLLTKILEWGRLMAYLEQSTRYINYAEPQSNGRYRYYRGSELLRACPDYASTMDGIFSEYGAMVDIMVEYFTALFPRDPEVSPGAHRTAVRAKAFDSLRGLLPAATVSNLGIYGSGQAYEHLLMRMRSHPLLEARQYAEMMLQELRLVIPNFLQRVDLADRGEAWSRYFSQTRVAIETLAREFLDDLRPVCDSEVTLVDFDPQAEVKLVTACLYSASSLSESQIRQRVESMSTEDRLRVLVAYVGERLNRRHKPGRAFERVNYRFDVLSNYGAFRDLQRHRMLTLEWQTLTPAHGFDMPSSIVEAGLAGRFETVIERATDLFGQLLKAVDIPGASYAVPLASKVRYVMQFNLREAFHVLELRTGEQAHPDYRRICYEMYRQIAEVAGHGAIAALMSFIGNPSEAQLERLRAESKAAARRQ